ncbi:GMC family oxidoreductase [Oharaeibacter diazotrophicus]|uniref:Pyridoxine 4-oxidase n=1 Tax=Oharaeibacter diazotrophicus TaxID=1920512 RepID=A0A4R6R7F6_9HYPH|nr:GMC family oxidoreductase N-terminal domain-containing protein [Oharaeibacter diazotrophicus]TDP81911.1 pyridoxine 4-oxidase [Oharaeibacter diazotrophicus]BBE73543.1 pyridoxine 4-oxidase [Pleomorphomonas sp. SM30]GLS75333.1 pyridoxine 4-oxidase [Oharaeibacter diazotrophicus]
MDRSFDVLIVGAGSAGSVLAWRLSEEPGLRVGVLEAGGHPDDPDIAIPQKWPVLQDRPYDWAYRTLPQAGTAGRVHPWPRGRLVGGSSCIHAMAHVRGHADDFAPWAEATGSDAWSHAGLLPSFRRIEAFSGGASAQHGGDGPLPVWLPDAELAPVVRAYMAAGLARGVPHIGEHNGGPLKGVAANSLTIRDGRRVSAADAFLVPVLGRPNLTLVTGVRVHRLAFDGDRVTGVEAEVDGRPARFSAGTVLLAAGAVASPLLLMRSGVGPAADLSRAGIPVRLDRAGVGDNLHDHMLTAGNVYRARRPVPPSRLQHSESLMYLDADDPTRADGAPSVVLGCVAAPTTSERLAPVDYGTGFTILSGVTHPTSRGRLTVTGPGLDDAPSIDPAYFTTDHDRELGVRALELAREIGAAPELADWRAEEIHPGPAVRGRAALAAFVAEASITHHHPVGTCRMGADADAVVDARLKVNGLDGLHVVDASVIPSITSGPVHAAVLAIADRFAGDFLAAGRG